MKNNKNFDLLTADANYIEGAIKALETFIFYRINDNKAVKNEIDELNGLVTAIKLLSEKHANEMAESTY